jgi:erythromycin 3''-O-methyltransferase
MQGWTRANLRHIARLFRFGRRPGITIYESIGDDFFLAPAPGWLNLGLWERADEAPARACVRLVQTIADPLPREAVILDVANGLGEQDLVLRSMLEPRALIALNITEFQLHAGADRLRRADAMPLNADATSIPIAAGSIDGIISVEAAFHFPSRAAFYDEAMRVLKPGGVITMSDITVERRRGSVREVIAGLAQLRFWGIRRSMLASAGDVVHMLEQAGFVDVHLEMVTSRVLDPAFAMTRARLADAQAPRLQRWGARRALSQVELLRERGYLQYVLVRARVPNAGRPNVV